MNLEKIKKAIIKFNNIILSFLLFYIGIGISSSLWKIKKLFEEENIRWKQSKKLEQIEDMKKMY